MIEANIPTLSVEEIMQKIKVEIKKRKNGNGDLNRVRTQNLNINTIDIFSKKIKPFEYKEIYEVNDFNKYHDVEFIQNIYRGVLRREVDTYGLNHYLNLLRSGERSKTEILCAIRFSKEGKRQNIKISGIKKRYVMSIFYKIPIVSYFAKSFVFLFSIPKYLRRLNQLENYFLLQNSQNIENLTLFQEKINQQNNITINYFKSKADKSELENKADKSELENKADKSELKDKVTYKEFDLYLQTVNYAKEYMKISQQNMQNLIDEAKKRLPEELLNQKELLSISKEEKHRYDNFYVEFEDKFRGSREEIKERLKVYLTYINELSSIKDNIEILDIGCGRGEFLELLKENDYKNAKGIDINRVMVVKSKELGLNVEEADAIEYLSTLKDESLLVITGFHIIEHLKFEILMKLFEESYRVLKSGGMVIFETPNPENLVIGACDFYIDPTHRNPIPPIAIEFIAQSNKFKTEIKRVNGNFGESFENSFLNHQFASQMDYAVIGYKS